MSNIVSNTSQQKSQGLVYSGHKTAISTGIVSAKQGTYEASKIVKRSNQTDFSKTVIDNRKSKLGLTAASIAKTKLLTSIESEETRDYISITQKASQVISTTKTWKRFSTRRAQNPLHPLKERQKKQLIKRAKSAKSIQHALQDIVHKKIAQATARKGISFALGGTIGSILCVLISLLLGFLIFEAIASAFTGVTVANSTSQSSNHAHSIAGLTEYEQQVYDFLAEWGFDDVHIAAMMGNFYQESHFNPKLIEAHPIDAAHVGHGLGQWTGGRWYALEEYAKSQGKPWEDARVQLEYFRAYEYNNQVFRGKTPPSMINEAGVAWCDTNSFEQATSVEQATHIFCWGWERPNLKYANMKVRVGKAQEYYSYFIASASGQALKDATANQQLIAQAALNTPSPGYGLCMRWCSNVQQNAGLGEYRYPTASAAYYSCCSSDNRADLKVGMIVACPYSTASGYHDCGHVGTYIGDGKVMHNVGAVKIDDLDHWIEVYGNHGAWPVKWGWLGNKDLTQ